MPGKATSKSQFRLLKGIADGTIPEKGTLTKAKATEMLGGQTEQGLPERVVSATLGRLILRVKRAKGKRFRIG